MPRLNKGTLLGFIFYVTILPEWQLAATKILLTGTGNCVSRSSICQVDKSWLA